MATHKVYFLRRADGLTKIGTTTDLKERIRSLAKSHGPLEIVRVVEGDAKRERKLHHQFRHCHQFGEWFALTDDALGEVEALALGDEVPVTVSELRLTWEVAEAALAGEASDKINELIAYRANRAKVTRGKAVELLEADYGLPVSFVTHLQKRKANTISAYGLVAVKSAWRQEMTIHIAMLEAEMAALGRGSAGARTNDGAA